MFNSKEQINCSKQVANAWRKSHVCDWNKSGAVITYMGNVSGWRDAVRNPEDFCPGCLAFTANGEVWETVGGTNEHGANAWRLISSEDGGEA